LYNAKLLSMILAIVLFMGILSCGNASGNVVSTTQKLNFTLIPHKLGEPPMVPHPKKPFENCSLCHFDGSNVGSSIKISKEHHCEECHVDLDYDGPCQESSFADITCGIDICHLYP